MEILLTAGWLLIGAGAYCAIRARQLNDELRRSLPPSMELRRQERPLHGRPEETRGGLLAELERELHTSEEAILDRVLPLRWRVSSHSPAHDALIYRMWRLMRAAFALFVAGLSLVAAGAGRLV